MQGRDFPEMYAEAVSLVKLYVGEAQRIRITGTGRQHAFALNRAGAYRRQAMALAYAMRQQNELSDSIHS